MTKAELIKAIESAPDHVPVYVVDESSGTASFFDVTLVVRVTDVRVTDGEIVEIHINH